LILVPNSAAIFSTAAGATMNQLRAILTAAGLSFVTCSVAAANDSAAELSLGGLKFTRSPTVEMRSEDLRISLDRVSVRYEFFNTAATPVTLTVAFPLPDVDLSEGDSLSFPTGDPLNFVGFETKVDGNAIQFQTDQRAFIGERDVTDQLRGLKVPVLPIGAQQFRPQDLPEDLRTKMASAGLLMPAGSNERGRPLYAPGWTVKTAVHREQTFAPGKVVVVEHSYRPSVGASFDTILRKPLRQDKALAKEVERYRKEYCVSDEFLRELDKVAGTARGDADKIQEKRISYILKTGANWAGPIKSFRLSIDKGNRLVSFCPGKLTRPSPSSLEITATDFTPDRDIKLLFIGKL
jgi:hypothetical protein